MFISYLGSLDFAIINRNEFNLSCIYDGEMLLRQCLQLQKTHQCLFLTLAPWGFEIGLFLYFFLVYAGSGSGQSVLIWTDPEHRESKETVLCPLGWK